jgi:hypothetical protein
MIGAEAKLLRPEELLRSSATRNDARPLTACPAKDIVKFEWLGQEICADKPAYEEVRGRSNLMSREAITRGWIHRTDAGSIPVRAEIRA